MNENNSIEAINKINLTEQTKFRLNEIAGIESYFYQEINERKSYCKKLNKYTTIFDYIDKFLIILSAASGGVLIISFTSIVGAPTGITSACLTSIFSLAKGITKILLKITRNKRKKHDKILMVAKSTLNSIEKLISKALSDMEISHEEFTVILDEKDRYERMKYELKGDTSENNKIMRLRSMYKLKNNF